MKQSRIILENVDVVLSGRKVLRELNWRLASGEHWGILGRNGSGKTSFLRLIKGELWPAPRHGGRRVYHLDGRESRSVAGLDRAFGFVSPELQAMYIRGEWSVSALEIVLSGPSGGLRLYEEPGAEHIEAALVLMERYGVVGLRDRPLHELSMGQGRKVLLCRALAARPKILLLDEFLDGVDTASRPDLLRAVESAATDTSADGSQVVMATHRLDDLILPIDRILILDRGRITAQGSRAEILERYRPDAEQEAGPSNHSRPMPTVQAGQDGRGSNEYVVRIEQASVVYNGAAALLDIDWEILPGEGWVVTGQNGAGKSTLLKLILGDVHPLPGGRIRHFGQSDRTGRSGRMSVWEIKKRIGHVGAEFQARYKQEVTAEEVVLSGLEASIGLYREFTTEERDLARRWLGFFGLADLTEITVGILSQGQQRRVMLARAMMTGPELLLLDEPCAGLDAESRRDFLRFLTKLHVLGTSVVYVTHCSGEVDGLGLQELRLEEGRVAGRGGEKTVHATAHGVGS